MHDRPSSPNRARARLLPSGAAMTRSQQVESLSKESDDAAATVSSGVKGFRSRCFGARRRADLLFRYLSLLKEKKCSR
jgi:hypothetical protein